MFFFNDNTSSAELILSRSRKNATPKEKVRVSSEIVLSVLKECLDS